MLAVVIVMVTLLLSLIGCIGSDYGKTYTLEPIDAKQVSSIIYRQWITEQENIITEITDKDEIADIIKVIFCDGKGRTTTIESMSDNIRDDATGVLSVNISYQQENESKSFSFRLYKTKKAGYLNFPYFANFKISMEDYNSLAKYMDKNE